MKAWIKKRSKFEIQIQSKSKRFLRKQATVICDMAPSSMDQPFVSNLNPRLSQAQPWRQRSSELVQEITYELCTILHLENEIRHPLFVTTLFQKMLNDVDKCDSHHGGVQVTPAQCLCPDNSARRAIVGFDEPPALQVHAQVVMSVGKRAEDHKHPHRRPSRDPLHEDPTKFLALATLD
jgi:hypothetical protein